MRLFALTRSLADADDSVAAFFDGGWSPSEAESSMRSARRSFACFSRCYVYSVQRAKEGDVAERNEGSCGAVMSEPRRKRL